MSSISIINLNKLTAYLLIPFSGFYLAGITPLSPIYFLVVFSSVLFISLKFKNNSVFADRTVILSLSCAFYYLMSQLLLTPNVGSLVNITISFSYYALTLIVIRKLILTDLKKVLNVFNYVSFLLLSVELVWRLTHPVFIISETGELPSNTIEVILYAYKKSSIMFGDSNFVGIYALCMAFLNYYLLKKGFWGKRYPIFLFSFFILGSLSRSAIISALFSFLILPVLLNSTNKTRKYVTYLLMVAFIPVTYFLIQGDSSFQSKFRIILRTVDFLSTAHLPTLLFGIGFGNTVDYFGVGAHNLFITYILESGIIGLFLFLLFQFYLIFKTKKESLYLTLPLFISGYSLVGHAIPFYYAGLAIIYYLSKHNIERFETSIRFNSNI